VPPSGGTTCVDISRAAGKTLSLDSDTTLSCLVFNPQGDAKSVTISGSGKIIHDCPNYMVGLSVGPEREVVFDVDVVKPAFGQTSYNSPVIVGGGRVVVKKNFPGTTKDDTVSYKRPAYVIDGELAFAGTTRFVSEDSNSLFGIGTWEIAGKSRILFEDGCSVDAWRMDPSPLRNVVSSDEWIQKGGSVSLMNLYFTSYYSKRRTPFSYTLNGGNMTVQGELCVGSAYYTAETRYPGGDFVMNGGTLTVGEFRCQRNDNRIRLNGGDVFLRNGFVDTLSAGQAMTNDLALFFGGVTIHSQASWTSALQAEFIGTPTFDTAGFNATFAKVVSGEGGLVKSGDGSLTFSETASFTGPVTVNGGNLVFGSSVDGPSNFNVQSGVLSFETEPANLDRIAITSGGKISIDCEKVVVRSLTVNGVERGAGRYSIAQGYFGRWLSGIGELIVLEGTGPGFIMTVR
jgi:autotransporter-associated beta strand protein